MVGKGWYGLEWCFWAGSCTVSQPLIEEGTRTNRFSIVGKPKAAPLNEDNDDRDDEADADDDDPTSTSDESDLGLHDATNDDQYEDGQNTNGNASNINGEVNGKNPVTQLKKYNDSKKGLHRKQRGLMQWKPMRNMQFAKDEAKFAVRRTMKKASLQGRQPGVETEA